VKTRSISLICVPFSFAFCFSLQAQTRNDFFKQGQSSDSAGQYGNAVMSYTKVIELKPHDTAALFKRGIDNCRLSNFAAAVTDFDTLIKLNPVSDYKAYYGKGAGLALLGKKEEALKALQKSIEINAYYYSAYYTRYSIYYNANQFANCAADIEHMLKLDTTGQAKLYYVLSYCYRQTGDTNRALLNINIAIQKGYKNARAYNDRGQILMWQNSNAFAIDDFKTALMYPRDSANTGIIFLNLGSASMNMGLKKDAIIYWKKAKDLRYPLPQNILDMLKEEGKE
jgi:tetratricopeptide (TPR) repeat protein